MGWDGAHTLLTTPISLGDVSYATHIGGPPYDLGYMIKNTGSLATWAKGIPVPSTNPGIITEAERKAANHGLKNIPIFQNKTMANLFNFWVEGSTASADQPVCGRNPSGGYWAYVHPSTWAAGNWYRALDFTNYCPSCKYPIQGLKQGNNIAKDSGGYLEITYNRDYVNAYTRDFRDFQYDTGQGSYVQGTAMYFCVGMQKSNSSGALPPSVARDRFVLCGSQLSVDNSFNMRKNINGSSITTGYYYIFPFLTSFISSTFSLPNTAGTLIPLSSARLVQMWEGRINYLLDITGVTYGDVTGMSLKTTIRVTNSDPSTTFTSVTMTVTAYEGNTVLGTQTGLTISSIAASSSKSVDSIISMPSGKYFFDTTRIVVTITAKNPDTAMGPTSIEYIPVWG